MFEVGDLVRIIEKAQGKGEKTKQSKGKVIYANNMFITVQKESKENKRYNTSFMMNDILNKVVKVAKI